MPQLLQYSAVVCSSDLVALGLMDALREHGVEPGRDVSIVGYDNIEENVNCATAKPILSTIDRSARDRGRAAAALLLECLEQPDQAPSVRSVPTRFIQRMSMAEPRRRVS